MKGFIETLRTARADAVLFERANGAGVTAGEIRAAAARAMQFAPKTDAPLFLFTRSAALLCAGLLAGAALRRGLSILPQAQPGYLDAIGAAPEMFLTDGGDTPTLRFDGEDATIDTDDFLALDFFTSGSTSAPKIVAKSLLHLEREVRVWESMHGGRCDAVRGTVSHQHVYGMIFRVLWPVMAGWTADDVAALAWEELEDEIGPRVALASSPAHLTRLPPDFALPRGAPAFVFTSGQMLPWDAAQNTRALFGVAPTEVLGSTETGGIAWRLRTEENAAWTPLQGVTVSKDADEALHVASPFTDAPAPLATGDRITLHEDGRFTLLGRVDRVAKIDGKRVSLSRVEEALRGTGLVSDAAALTLDSRRGALAAVVMLTPDGLAGLRDDGAFRFTRRLRATLAETLEPAERPKHWRFVGAMPVNSQGKRQIASLARLFEIESMLALLRATPRTLDATRAIIAFTPAPELRWFDGHFPGAPIMPGIAQVHIAARLAEELWSFEPSSSTLHRVKFRKPMKPGRPVELDLSIEPARRRIAFRFAGNGEPISEGVVGGD